jgi:hypothetical protein
MDDADFHWLVGLLEGEGCFGLSPGRAYKTSVYRYPRIVLNMTDEDVVARGAQLLGCKYHRQRHGRHKDTFTACLQGKRAADLMQALLPHMGARRQQRIVAILEGYRTKTLPGQALVQFEDTPRRRTSREWGRRRRALLKETHAGVAQR